MTAPPRGHFKVARKAYDPVHGDPWCLEPRAYSRWEAWLFLIQLAQWQPEHTRQTKYGLVTSKRGEFVASLRWLAEQFGWSPASVRRFLLDAEKTQRIVKQSEHHAGTVYLIAKYDRYQSGAVEADTDHETDHDTDEKQTRNKNKQEKQGKQNTKTPSESPDVAAVVAHYLTRHPRRSVSAKARALVARVLGGGWTVADVVAAIDGNANDDWHAQKRKHELEYVLRDDKRDGFREQGEAGGVPELTGPEIVDGWMSPEFERLTRPAGVRPWAA
jgi:hypothetical protein